MLVVPIVLSACVGGQLSSEAEAELAYLGLDGAVSLGLSLGLQGFNAASSANIDDQLGAGREAGTMTISGQVDQGSSDNKGLRLFVALDGYSDLLDDEGEPDFIYSTDAADLPALTLQLRDIPEGTLEGSLLGDFSMEGTLHGPVTLDLLMSGELTSDGADGVVREEGSTEITGTATSDYGVFDVDVVR